MTFSPNLDQMTPEQLRALAEQAMQLLPGVSGNVCTEGLVHMLQLMGYNTGVDLEGILRASARLPQLIAHETLSQILKAGKRLDLHPIPEHVHTLSKQVVSNTAEDIK